MNESTGQRARAREAWKHIAVSGGFQYSLVFFFFCFLFALPPRAAVYTRISRCAAPIRFRESRQIGQGRGEGKVCFLSPEY